MSRKYFVLMALLSFQALADVSFQEKQNRVEFLEGLQKKVPMMDIDAYRRELQYEKSNLSVEERASSEAGLLAEQIKTQISRAYEAAIAVKSQDEAVAELRNAIETDSKLLSPELREEIKELSLRALEDIQSGKISSEENLENIESAMMKGAQERYDFLNTEAELLSLKAMAYSSGVGKSITAADTSAYASKSELLESLASEEENSRWVNTGGINLKSQVQKKRDSSVNLQVKAEFLGVSLSAGPTFAFRREYSSDVAIMAEGMQPILLPDGNFDFYKRDKAGNVIKKKGKPEKRYMNFVCDVGLTFETETKAGGGFSIVGMGGGGSVSSVYKNEVDLISRRIVIPETIDGKSTTFKALADLCLNDFLRARITNNMTIADSLNMMMKNTVASLRFSHPKTKCAQDSHCSKWYNNEVLALAKVSNTARCVETSEQSYQCELRGLKGQNCTVYDSKGKRISDGMYEFKCDAGLKCVKYKDAGWLKGLSLYQYAKGKCQ